jgi:PIN domain-containing protein
LRGLGYVAHTPAELFGSREAASGADDENWLTRVGRQGWTIIGRDLKIYERPSELAAYKRARVQMFLLPGQVKSAELVYLVEVNLRDICAITTLKQVGTWRLTKAGPEAYDVDNPPWAMIPVFCPLQNPGPPQRESWARYVYGR